MIKSKEATIKCPHCGERIRIRKIEAVESAIKDTEKSFRDIMKAAFEKVLGKDS